MKKIPFDLLINLVIKELKVRYKASILGFFWSLFRPLLIILVFSVVFSKFMRFNNLPYASVSYAAFFLCGYLPWMFVQDSLHGAASSLVQNANLIQKVAFPRWIFPFSVVCSHTINFLLALFVLFPVFSMVFDIPFSPSLIFLIPLFLLLFFLIAGLGVLLALLNVYFRDTAIFLDVGVMIWFYLSPILYPINLVHSELANHPWMWKLYCLNPMVILSFAFQNSFLGGCGYQGEIPFTNFQLFVGILWVFLLSSIVCICAIILYKKLSKFLADRL